MQTAVAESSGAANPRVPVLKLRVVSLSPTFAGRDLTWCRLKSHMAEELLFCERPTNPTPVAKNGLISQHAWLAKEGPQAERGNAPYRKYQVVTDEELTTDCLFRSTGEHIRARIVVSSHSIGPSLRAMTNG